MLQIAIDNPPIESYFKTQEVVKSFLENAAMLDLLGIVDEIKNDELHQKSLRDIKDKNITFYENSKTLIEALRKK